MCQLANNFFSLGGVEGEGPTYFVGCDEGPTSSVACDEGPTSSVAWGASFGNQPFVVFFSQIPFPTQHLRN
jgi:hypothetical protein